MTTQTIGIREFRQNMKSLRKNAQKKDICYVVMSHQTPLWRAEPIDEDYLILEKHGAEIQVALNEVKQGKTHSLDYVMKGIRKRNAKGK